MENGGNFAGAKFGAPDRSRTCNRWNRNPILYPIELRVHCGEHTKGFFLKKQLERIGAALSAAEFFKGLCAGVDWASFYRPQQQNPL